MRFSTIAPPPIGRRLLAFAVLLAAILLPFALFEAQVTGLAIRAVEAGADRPFVSTATIVALLAGDVVLPVPSSLVSTYAGAALGFPIGVAAIWLGMMAGCLLGYAIGAGAGRPALIRLVGRRDLARARAALTGAGGVAIVLVRGVPVLAEMSVIGAGAARMPLGTFLALSALANLAAAIAYAAIGALFLASGRFLLVFLALAALPSIGWIAWTRFSAGSRSHG